MTTVQMQDHPIYTFTPQFRSHLESNLRKFLYINFFKKVEDYLNDKQTYGVLIIDDQSMGLISQLFSPTDLAEFRIVFKEKLETQRQNTQHLTAIYAIKPTPDKLIRIAEDFGYDSGKQLKIKKIDEVKQMRDYEKCCYQPYKNFNPYLYNGVFILANGALDIGILENTGLNNILSKQQYFEYSIDFIPRESHFIELGSDNNFQKIFLPKKNNNVQNYISSQSTKLFEIIKQYNIQNVRIKYQKSNDISKQIAQQLDKQLAQQEDSANQPQTILLICDRIIDILQLLQQSNKFGPLLLEQLEFNGYNSKTALSKIRKMQQEQQISIKEEYKIENITIIERINPIFIALRTKNYKTAKREFAMAYNAYCQVYNFYYDMSNQNTNAHNQKQMVISQKLDNNEEKTLIFSKVNLIEATNISIVFNEQHNFIKQFWPFNEAYDVLTNKNIIQTAISIQNILFQVLIGQHPISYLATQKLVNSNSLQHEIAKMIKDQYTQMLALKFILYQHLLYMLNPKITNQHLEFKRYSSNNINKLTNQCGEIIENIYNGCIQLFEQYNIVNILQQYIQLWKDLSKTYSDNNKQIETQSLIELICKCFICGSEHILNKLFDDLYEAENYQPIKLPDYGHSQVKEMRLAKARFYEASLNSRKTLEQQEKDDEQQFMQSQKILIYVSGGVTYEEIAAVQQLTISNPQIGFFNTGIQQLQPYFVLISDTVMNQNQFLESVASNCKLEAELSPNATSSKNEVFNQ